jgi:hypothetical protein
MASMHDAPAPRKKMVTYGKAARKRLPDFSFASMARTSETPESQGQRESEEPSEALPSNPRKLKPVRQKSVPRTSPSASSLGQNVFDVPGDDETLKPVQKPANDPKKLKPVRQRSVSTVPPSPPAKGVFDVPDDDAPQHKRKLANTPQKLKGAQQRLASRASSLPASPPAQDIFDVPDEEEPPPPTPKPAQKSQQVVRIRNGKEKAAREISAVVPELASRKKLKLSPVHEPALKSLPIHNLTGPALPSRPVHAPPLKRLPIHNVTAPALPNRPIPYPDRKRKLQSSPRSRDLKDARLLAPRKIEPLRTPQKQSPQPVQGFCTPSPPLSDADMRDSGSQGKHLSPKALKLWKDLLDSAEGTSEDVSENSDTIVQDAAAKNDATTSARRPNPSLSRPTRAPAQKKNSKRRLIDSLVEQVTYVDSTDEEGSDDVMSEPKRDPAPSLALPTSTSQTSRSQSIVPETLNASVMLSDSQGSQPVGPKFTYSRQRSMLAEQDLMQQLAMDMPIQPAQASHGRKHRRGSIPRVKPLASFHEEVEDDEGASTAIRSVHELRQAGAVNRFLDETQDFLERIGSPHSTQLSMRRSGLLDLGSKMQDKRFARQFRANGVEQRLFVHLGQENDIISGFIMVSLLIAVLMDGSMPHIVAHLRRQGITRLLIRLLECKSSIIAIGKERNSNMSKVGQSLLAEHHENFLQLPIWEELQPQVISPRTMALKCLEMMVRQTREAGNSGDIFSKELTTNLFAILKSASDESSWDLPRGRCAIDFNLALSALESHSVIARTVHDETIWINEYLPIIADASEVALARPVESFGVLQVLILRLTLNVTNNNPRASDVFARSALMAAMGQALVAKFKQISRFLTEDDLSVAVVHLILVLGVMINFAEWSSAARESLQSLEGKSDDPLDAMVQTFLDNQERTSEVRYTPA